MKKTRAFIQKKMRPQAILLYKAYEVNTEINTFTICSLNQQMHVRYYS